MSLYVTAVSTVGFLDIIITSTTKLVGAAGICSVVHGNLGVHKMV